MARAMSRRHLEPGRSVYAPSPVCYPLDRFAPWRSYHTMGSPVDDTIGMDSTGQSDELIKAIARTIEEHISRSKSGAGWPQGLKHPILRLDAFLEEQGSDQDQEDTLSRPFQVGSVRTYGFPFASFVTPSNTSQTRPLVSCIAGTGMRK
jgi:hypothetical protein